MKFIDEVELEVVAGDGGNGCVAFRREAHVPRGGPSGGDGGQGGDVTFEADRRLGTLFDLSLRRKVAAERGEDGRGKDQYGRGGESVVVRVPVGTEVLDAESGARLADLDAEGSRFVVARGGRGGRGNIHFATSTDRAPRRAEPGTPGERRRIRLSLKLLADAGLVGFPNAGKSTLISHVSRARPKIADYPFTTLVPNLGVVSIGQEASFVLADVPGLIPGAAEGAGLGTRFLRHLERTRVLVYLLAPDDAPGREPLDDLATLEGEVGAFDADLAQRPRLIAWNKIDLPDARERVAELATALETRGFRLYAISAATGEGVDELMRAVYTQVAHARRESATTVTSE